MVRRKCSLVLTSLTLLLQPHVSVVVSQSSLDVELWLNGALQSQLEARGFTFHSLTDYDLQLVEVGGHVSGSDAHVIISPPQVCAEHGDVVFLVVVMLEASGHSPSA